MTDNQTRKNRSLKKRHSIIALLLIPFLFLGLGSIWYQFIAGNNDGGVFGFDFNIGKLWAPEEVEIPAEEISRNTWNNLLASSSDNTEETRNDEKVSAASSRAEFYNNPISKNLGAKKEIVKVKEAEIYSKISIPALNLKHHELKTISENTFSYKYAQKLEKPYLINPNLSVKKSKFSIGLSFAPNYSFRVLKYRSSDVYATRVDPGAVYTFSQTEGYRNSNDKPTSNFFASLDVYYRLGDRVSISSGLSYATFGERIQVLKLGDNHPARTDNPLFFDLPPWYGSPETESAEGSDIIPFDNRYSYIEVPIMAHVKIAQIDNIRLDGQIGGAIGFLDHADALVYDFETDYYYWLPKKDVGVYNQQIYSTTVGLNVSQYISNQIELFANPQIRYNLSSTFKNNYGIRQNQYATALRLGFRLNL